MVEIEGLENDFRAFGPLVLQGFHPLAHPPIFCYNLPRPGQRNNGSKPDKRQRSLPS
jgi:hypothetical protein